MRNRLLALTAALGTTLIASPIAWAADAPGAIYMNASDIKWGDAPASLPKGAMIAVLSGDPGKPGIWSGRLKMPAGYKIPPHWHSTDEDLTVISGTFHLAEGDKPDTKHAHAIKAGGFHHLPAKAHHSAYTKEPTVVQITAMGPFDIVYLDPKDDPAKAAEAPKK
ncbi:MAG TPA: cupin domain-containing protein [Usitatibacter sp.]